MNELHYSHLIRASHHIYVHLVHYLHDSICHITLRNQTQDFMSKAKSTAKHSQAAVAQIHSISTDHSEPTRVEDKSSQGTPGDEAVIMMHTGGLGNSTVLGEAVLGRLPRRILQHRSHLKAHHIGDPTCRSPNAQSSSYTE